MTNEIKRQLKKLSNKRFAKDIKLYIRAPYKFYGDRVPEIKVLAKRLHEEHTLKEFYKIFDRLWNSGYHEEMSLALYALELYKGDFNMETWEFIKKKLNEVKSFDKADAIASGIIGELLLKYPKLEKNVLDMSKSKNFCIRRTAIVATIPQIKKNNIKLAMRIAEKFIDDKDTYVQKATGVVLREAAKNNHQIVKEFLLGHIDINYNIFSKATEDMKGLRKIRNKKKLRSKKQGATTH